MSDPSGMSNPFSYEALRDKPASFLRFVGLTPSQFEEVVERVRGEQQQRRQQRIEQRGPHARRLGQGNKPRHSLEDRVMMVLLYHRQYWTLETIGTAFGLDASTVGKLVKSLRELIAAVLPHPHRLLERLEEELEALEQVPGTEPPCQLDLLVDATEQAIQRPQDDQIQRAHYSGKKKRHTRKTQIATTTTELILHASKSTQGRCHDYRLFKEDDMLTQIHPLAQRFQRLCIWGDSGYQGMTTDFTQLETRLSRRARRNHPLEEADKAHNKAVGRVRIGVEHVLSRLKKYRILDYRFRNRSTEYDACFLLVAGLVNWRRLDALGLSHLTCANRA
jgi:hypothetical protein